MIKQFGVIGLGRFGSSVAITLEKLGYQVLAIDKNETKVDALKDFVTHAKQTDATDADALKEAGIANCDVVVVAIGGDMQNSILTTMVLKDMGTKRIIVKASNAMHGKVIEKIGVEKIVYPEKDTGIRIAHQLVSSNILDFIQVSSDYSMEEIKISEDLKGSTLKDLNLRKKYDIEVLAIKRRDKLVLVPHAEEELILNDILIIIGKTENVREFEKSF